MLSCGQAWIFWNNFLSLSKWLTSGGVSAAGAGAGVSVFCLCCPVFRGKESFFLLVLLLVRACMLVACLLLCCYVNALCAGSILFAGCLAVLCMGEMVILVYWYMVAGWALVLWFVPV